MSNENSNIIKMEDGSIVNFGTRAKLVTTVKVEETSFTVVFNLLSSRIITYSYVSSIPLPRILLEMAAFGAASKAKAAASNGSTETEIIEILETKVAEYQEGIFVSRGTTSMSGTLNMTQQAYCVVNGLDPFDPEVVVTTKATFDGMSKEDKAALSKTVPMKVAIGQIRLAQAQAELAAMESEVA